MKVQIDNTVLEKYPSLQLGIIIAKGIDNKGEKKEVLSILKAQQQKIREKFAIETLAEQPKVIAWREAYINFGAKPKKYKCSVENLYRMILKNIEIEHINTIVDIYNFISIKHIIPVGGDDTDKIDGDITLTTAKGDEPFIVLNSEEVSQPKEGEVVYRDNKEVLCRRWNWRECNKSKMTEETTNVCLVVEALPPVTKEELSNILQEFSGLVQRYCGGEIKTEIISAENNNLDF